MEVSSEDLKVPESRTSIMASLLGVLVDKRSDERTSRLMRGSVAIVIEDILLLIRDFRYRYAELSKLSFIASGFSNTEKKKW